MDGLSIRLLGENEEAPYHLLLMADPSKEAVHEYINRGIVCVACLKEKIIGIYVLIKTRPFTLELVNVAVSEEYQGKGIGKRLVWDSISRAKMEKAKVLEVGTGNSGISQLALYQKCGFRITGIDRDFFKKHYEEKIFENGIPCLDMVRLSIDLSDTYL